MRLNDIVTPEEFYKAASAEQDVAQATGDDFPTLVSAILATLSTLDKAIEEKYKGSPSPVEIDFETEKEKTTHAS
jgi:hypothetical protein